MGLLLLAVGLFALASSSSKPKPGPVRPEDLPEDAEAIRAEVERIARESREIIDGERDEYSVSDDEQEAWES